MTPRARPAAPPPPPWLSRAAQDDWRRLAAQLAERGPLEAADELTLELLVEALHEWRKASAIVAKKGLSYETARGFAPRPEVSIARIAWKRAASLLRELRLTPASRRRPVRRAAPVLPALPHAIRVRGVAPHSGARITKDAPHHED